MDHMKKFLAGGMSAALASLTLASVALAAPPHHPTGEFAQFANCPLSQPMPIDCLYHVIDGGSITIGKRTVPIKNPITLQGGFGGEGSEISYFGAEDGNTLSKVAQPVPGGLLGLNPPSWWPKAAKEKFNSIVDKGITGVTATVELAGPATSIKLSTANYINQEGAAIEIPMKVKLDNRLLGSNCYIGSNADPMVLKLGTGITAPPAPNQPIQGAPGEITFNQSFTLITIADGRLVDNAFAVPKARGCGGLLSPFIDPLVNSILGTPSPGGRNTAILEGTLQIATGNAVRESES
jgi:hypothetical protein